MAMDGLRYAIRGMRGSRGVLAAAAATLALGIGGATAMFAVVDAVLLNPLPYRNGDRLLEVFVAHTATDQRPGMSGAAIEALRSVPAFAAVEAYRLGSATLTDGDPEMVVMPSITPGLLEALGAVPRLGRLFTADDARHGDAVLVSERLWRTRFSADERIVGRRIAIEGEPVTIAGVLPAWFAFPESRVEVWRPLSIGGAPVPAATNNAVVILRPGVSREAADGLLRASSDALRQAAGLETGASFVLADPVQRRLAERYRTELSLLLGAVLLVLLVACVNVGHLLLAKGAARQGELAVMSALGASRGHAAGRSLAEAALVALFGGLAGVLVARVLLVTMLASTSDQLSFFTAGAIGLDWRALAFACALAAATCLAVALVPAWRASRVDLVEALRGHSPGAGGGHDRWHGGMVVTQLVLVVTLLATAGLLLRSFTRLVSVAPGFDVDHLVVAEIRLPRERYREAGGALTIVRELQRRLAAAPGIQAVTYSEGAPPTGGSFSFDLRPEAEGQPAREVPELKLPRMTVAPDYFRTLRIPMTAGRPFDLADGGEALIVNTVLARRFWGDVSPIGQRFRLGPDDPWMTVVGVAGDVKVMGLDDPMGEGMEIYHPYEAGHRAGFFAVSIRSADDPAIVVRRVRDELKALDPLLPIMSARTMTQRLERSVARPRFLLRLCGIFAIVAAVMAAIGVYGTSAYWVERRRRELGVRLAIGSSPAGIVRLVIGRCVRLAVWAGVIGFGATLLLARTLQSLLFETGPLDPATLGTALVAVIGLVVAACAVPALRASRLDPVRVLRSE